MRRYFDTVIRPDGVPLAGASVLVTATGTVTPASALFADAAGTIPTTNPVATDAAGRFGFYAADGRYDLTVSAPGFTPFVLADVLLEDPADPNAASVSRLSVRETGADARMGLATLTAGSVVVNTTAVTANSRIFLAAQAAGGTPGALRVNARTPGASFTISSSSGTDTSIVAWLIVEPA